MRRFVLLLGVLAATALGDDDTRTFDEHEFSLVAEPILRCHILTEYHYTKYAAAEEKAEVDRTVRSTKGKTTFRHLMEHLKATLKNYANFKPADLKRPEAKRIVRGVRDEFINICEAGEVPLDGCKQRLAHDDEACKKVEEDAILRDEGRVNQKRSDLEKRREEADRRQKEDAELAAASKEEEKKKAKRAAKEDIKKSKKNAWGDDLDDEEPWGDGHDDEL
jgi:hypothetical protein